MMIYLSSVFPKDPNVAIGYVRICRWEMRTKPCGLKIDECDTSTTLVIFQLPLTKGMKCTLI